MQFPEQPHGGAAAQRSGPRGSRWPSGRRSPPTEGPGRGPEATVPRLPEAGSGLEGANSGPGPAQAHPVGHPPTAGVERGGGHHRPHFTEEPSGRGEAQAAGGRYPGTAARAGCGHEGLRPQSPGGGLGRSRGGAAGTGQLWQEGAAVEKRAGPGRLQTLPAACKWVRRAEPRCLKCFHGSHLLCTRSRGLVTGNPLGGLWPRTGWG